MILRVQALRSGKKGATKREENEQHVDDLAGELQVLATQRKTAVVISSMGSNDSLWYPFLPRSH